MTALSERLPEEMLSFVEKETKSGKLTYGAVRGKYDDLVMCYAIAAYVMYQVVDGEHGVCLNVDHSNVVSTDFSPVAGTRSGMQKVYHGSKDLNQSSNVFAVLKNQKSISSFGRDAIIEDIMKGRI